MKEGRDRKKEKREIRRRYLNRKAKDKRQPAIGRSELGYEDAAAGPKKARYNAQCSCGLRSPQFHTTFLVFFFFLSTL
jgi:hypothetical protein